MSGQKDGELVTSDYLEQRLTLIEQRFETRLVTALADLRVDLLKWSFLFWLGQVAVIAGLLQMVLGR